MTEIKGFNEAFARAEEIENVKRLAKKYRQRRINELVAMGIDRKMAATMFDAGAAQ